MKSIIKKLLPKKLRKFLVELLQIQRWRARGYLENAPQLVKQNLFVKYGVPQAQWVETGTHLGETTDFLSKNYSFVYSIEPGKELYKNAMKKFLNQNVELFNGVSEDVMPSLLPRLKGDINFWLDGHYSAGVTFKGNKNCPVEEELIAIKNNLLNFTKVSILIDDIRCFLPTNTTYSDYPSIDFLVDWARVNNFNWRVEQDVFVMRNFF
jgi:hypothetical protein